MYLVRYMSAAQHLFPTIPSTQVLDTTSFTEGNELHLAESPPESDGHGSQHHQNYTTSLREPVYPAVDPSSPIQPCPLGGASRTGIMATQRNINGSRGTNGHSNGHHSNGWWIATHARLERHIWKYTDRYYFQVATALGTRHLAIMASGKKPQFSWGPPSLSLCQM